MKFFFFNKKFIFLCRKFIDSLENRIAHYAKKRRIEIVSKNKLNVRKADLINDGNE